MSLRTVARGCADVLGSVVGQVGVGVAMKMSKNYRTFFLECMVRDAGNFGRDDTTKFVVLMKFVSEPNKAILRRRIDSALERWRLQNG